jgi:hypothetical protein
MLTARDEFSLQRFDRRSVKTPAFDRAIRIYCDTTGGGAKTDASQIVYWAERKDTEFSRAGDQVHVLGLLRDQEVVGFALIFYISERRLVVAVDATVGKGTFRNGGSFGDPPFSFLTSPWPSTQSTTRPPRYQPSLTLLLHDLAEATLGAVRRQMVVCIGGSSAR